MSSPDLWDIIQKDLLNLLEREKILIESNNHNSIQNKDFLI
jgi:hypothetical protein